jgi:hypothetical protein
LRNEKFESLKKDKDHEITLARSSISAYADELRKRAESPRRSLLPTPTASTGNPERTDYDLSELVEAMGEYTAEVGAIRREITDLVTEGARAISDLNGLKEWERDVRAVETSIAQPLD